MTQKRLRNDWQTAIRLWLFSMKKNLGTAGLVTACVSLLCPGLFFVNWSYPVYETPVLYNATDDAMIVMTIAAVFSCLLALLLVCLNFSYLYKKSAGDLYHALPLTRAKLLLARFAGCVLPALLPAVVNYAALFLLSADKNIVLPVPFLLSGLVLNVAVVLCVTAFATVFLVLCGTTFSFLASFAVFNLGIPAILFIGDHIAGLSLWGYTSDMLEVYYHCTPVLYAGTRYLTLYETTGWELWMHIGILVLLTAVFLLVSCLLYNRRKSEKAGTAYAFRPVRYGIMGITCYVGSFVIGYLFDSQFLPLFWLFAAIGSILIALAFGAIMDKGFKTAVRSLIVGGVCFGLLFGTFLGIGLDVVGYEDQLPALSQIESVVYEDMFGSPMEFDDPATIRSLHEFVIKRNPRDLLKVDPDEEKYNTWYSMDITYKLKNGQTVSRRYNSHDLTVRKQLTAFLFSDEYRQSIDRLVESAGEGHLYVGYYIWNPEGAYEDWFDLTLTEAEYTHFMDLYYSEGPAVDQNGEDYTTHQLVYYDQAGTSWAFHLPYSTKTCVKTTAYLHTLFEAQYPEKAALFQKKQANA